MKIGSLLKTKNCCYKHCTTNSSICCKTWLIFFLNSSRWGQTQGVRFREESPFEGKYLQNQSLLINHAIKPWILTPDE
jgi:hypothetical protein